MKVLRRLSGMKLRPLKNVLYTRYCSYIYRRDESHLYRFTIMHIKILHKLFKNGIRTVTYFLCLWLCRSQPLLFGNLPSCSCPKLLPSAAIFATCAQTKHLCILF
jgi:hypothetical protein